MSKYVVATFSTWVSPTVHVNRGEVWDAEDPVVTSHPDWFTDDFDASARRTAPRNQHGELPVPKAKPVESASAAPGEKRATRRV